MARSCLSSRLLARVQADMGFQALPLVVQAIWFRLMTASLAAPVPGFLRFFPSVSKGVSRAVSISETETETHLETLAALGLIEVSADGMEVSMPGAREAASRREAAKTNGNRGGRPRKGETAADAYARRQGHLALPIQGGAAAAGETQETELKPALESSRARPTTLNSTSESHSPVQSEPLAREEPALDIAAVTALGEELAEIVGMDPARGGHDHSAIRGWMRAASKRGIGQAEMSHALREMVTARAASLRGKARTWMYLQQGVLELIERLAGPEAGNAALTPAAAPRASGRPVMTPEIQALDRAWREDGMQDPIPPALLPYYAPALAA